MLIMLALSALLVGVCLGLMGAGGSIIAVPVLMLLLDMSEKLAVKHALIIVGLISLFGALRGMRKQPVNTRVLVTFAIASLPLASVGAIVGKQLPDGWQTLTLVALMLWSASKMLRPGEIQPGQTPSDATLLLAGAGTGLVTGIVGIGGGFLIVPALVLFAGLAMQQAVTNSLLLIAANALFAFATLSAVSMALPTDWLVVSIMVVSGVLALFAGQSLAAHINPKTLKTGFGLSLVGVAGALMVQLF